MHTYNDIISLENLLQAYKEFRKGKTKRKDVQEFERDLMRNIIQLHMDLINKTYIHSPYEAFNISDPKPRNIHKASVRDRLLHHAIYKRLYPFFDKTFITHSYSCRNNKGVHKALNTFRKFGYKVSKNHTKTVWVLKCDISRFFASIDHDVLLYILEQYLADKDLMNLLTIIIDSFHVEPGEGLPLGNLTSQLFTNIYMNEFDQWTKHKLKAKHYIRYADDFVFLHTDRRYLESIIPEIQEYLSKHLKLTLHPKKISIQTLASGVNYLGWVHFPTHRVIRTVTKRRMLRNIRNKQGNEATVQSYLGLLSHGNTRLLQEKVIEGVERFITK